MCPEVPRLCAPEYTGDPTIYAREAVALAVPFVEFFGFLAVLLSIVIITFLLSELLD